jgi:hypothetical protein
LWDLCQQDLAYDFILQNSNVAQLRIDHALEELSHLLEEYGKTLSDFLASLKLQFIHER